MKVTFMGKSVGEIRGDQTKAYITWRTPSSHIFRNFKGYGISVRIIDELIEQNVTKIIIEETEGEKRTLHSRLIKDWIASGIKWTDDSQGFEDPQLILPIDRMVSYSKNDQHPT
jgi:hypothetical protein